MGRRVNLSEPMMLDIIMTPLTESFGIEPQGANATTEQWYYANNGTYAPDRKTNPLTLSPVLSVYDPDGGQTHRPSFFRVVWRLLNEATGVYDIEITNTEDNADVDYVALPDGSLRVKKNVPATESVMLKCDVTYIDPRDSSVTHDISDTVTLATNQDARLLSPTVEIDTPMTIDYDPFAGGSSLVEFKATVRMGGEDVTLSSSLRWYASDGGTEYPIDDKAADGFPRFLGYDSGQGTRTLTLDALYHERLTVIARVMDTENGVLYPTKAYRTLRWKPSAVAAITKSDNGRAVRPTTESKTFDAIVNVCGRTLTEEEQREHLLINWRWRRSGYQTETDLGWGTRASMDGATMRSAASSLVLADVFLKGAYTRTAQDGMTVIMDGKAVVVRT